MTSITLTIGEHEVTIDEHTPEMYRWTRIDPDILQICVLSVCKKANRTDSPSKEQLESQIIAFESDLAGTAYEDYVERCYNN